MGSSPGTTVVDNPWEWNMIDHLGADEGSLIRNIYRAEKGAAAVSGNLRIDLDTVPEAYDKSDEIITHLLARS